jgi:hypothetical protein
MQTVKKKKGGFLANLAFNIFIPVFILSKFSGADDLGPVNALIVALAFPFLYGLWSFKEEGKVNFISVLGVLSVLMTGGIGLLQLDPAYVAIKEAAVPGIIFIVIVVSNQTRFPLVRKLLLNEEFVNLPKLHDALTRHNAQARFEEKVKVGSHVVAASFLLSSFLNYVLAKWIVVSPAGTEAFNEEIAKMTALSFPVIALPCTIVMMGAIFYIFRQISLLTGEKIEDFLISQ